MSKKHCSPAQKQLLLEFIESNPYLAKQKISSQYTGAEMRNKWMEIAATLNATPGVQKDWKDWRKCWSDIKTRIKKKQSDINRSAHKTGGGPSEYPPLDTLEERILNLIGGQEMIEGQITVPEPGLPMPLAQLIEVIEDPSFGVDLNKISCVTEDVDNEISCVTEDVDDEISCVTEDVDNEFSCASEDHSYTVKVNSQALQESGISGKRNNKRTRPPPGRSRCTTRVPLKASMQIAETVSNIASRKINIKKEYYKQKVQIMKENLEINKSVAKSLNNIANALNRNGK